MLSKASAPSFPKSGYFSFPSVFSEEEPESVFGIHGHPAETPDRTPQSFENPSCHLQINSSDAAARLLAIQFGVR
jgi:hypothetical protein